MSDPIVEALIRRDDPADAVASYYAYRGADASHLTVGTPSDGAVFVEAQGQLGPVGILRATRWTRAAEALALATPGSRYVMAPWRLRTVILGCGRATDPSRNRVFWMVDDARPVRLEVGFTRSVEDSVARIRRGDETVSICRCLWRSDRFAEVQVQTAEAYQRRGLARVALCALADHLARAGVTPIYVASKDNVASLALARSLSLIRTDEDEFAATVTFSK